LSMGITQFLNLLLITVYIKLANHCPESQLFVSRETFVVENLANYFKKAIPAALLFAADYIGFEILTFMASFLGPVSMAANVCLFNYITVIFIIQLGISMATNTLVGNSIGDKKKRLSLQYAFVSLILGLLIMVVTTAFTLYFRREIPYLYTHEKTVGELFYDLIGIYVIFALPDSASVILQGVIKGYGKQKWASIACLTILYPINITQAYFLAFHFKLGVMGLWYSQMITIFLLLISYAFIYVRVNLDEVIREIELLNVEKKKHEDDPEIKAE